MSASDRIEIILEALSPDYFNVVSMMHKETLNDLVTISYLDNIVFNFFGLKSTKLCRVKKRKSERVNSKKIV